MEDELRRRADELAEAGRRKDEFMAMLAHELRNPLAPIRNAAHVLRLRGEDAAAVGWAREVIDRQAAHMTRLVDELLDASRIARGKVALRREPLDLAGLARAAAEDHRGGLEAGGLALELDLPPAPVWVRGDPVRLAQVFGNLLANAAKFTDPGGRVVVRVARDGAEAVAAVRDSGIGFSPELEPRLFETFAQADSSLARSKGGLGLGLALVKGLVELHGGSVAAASDGPGRGAEFSFRLPVDREPRAAAPPDDGAPAPLRRVLLVEDNADAAASLRMVLELAGHEVAVAATGHEGVEEARRLRPEVVLCDLGLPGMSGFEVARALRADPATAAALLVAVSGYGRDEDQTQAQEAGFDAALVKPVEPAELARLLAHPPHRA
jgi:CheY-like chemotaxis protein/two-component sensor histidine kinase